MKAAGGQDPGLKYRHGGHRSRGVRASALGANSIPHAGAPTSFGTSLLGILSRSFPWCRGKPRGWFRSSCHDDLSLPRNRMCSRHLHAQIDSGRGMVQTRVTLAPERLNKSRRTEVVSGQRVDGLHCACIQYTHPHKVLPPTYRLLNVYVPRRDTPSGKEVGLA